MNPASIMIDITKETQSINRRRNRQLVTFKKQ